MKTTINPKTIRTGLIILLIATGAYLVIDHGQHLAPYFPFVFLLGCLFMHLFMHGSHGGHDHTNHSDQENEHK